jgi:hypothetical protein
VSVTVQFLRFLGSDDESDGHHCCTYCDGSQWDPKWLSALYVRVR